MCVILTINKLHNSEKLALDILKTLLSGEWASHFEVIDFEENDELVKFVIYSGIKNEDEIKSRHASAIASSALLRLNFDIEFKKTIMPNKKQRIIALE